jgi:hypothetical protein
LFDQPSDLFDRHEMDVAAASNAKGFEQKHLQERRRIPIVLPNMDQTPVCDRPSEVTAEEGDVIIDGPDGVAVTMTPDAAIETSHRLLKAGLLAQGQRLQKR